MMFNGGLVRIRFGNGIGNGTILVLVHRLMRISLVTKRRIPVNVMHGGMLVTHSLLAKLLAYSKLNAKCVFMKYPKLCSSAGKTRDERDGRGAIAMWNATVAGAAGDERRVRQAAGHGLLLHCLRAQQRRTGPVQPKQVGVELSRGSFGSCNRRLESDLGNYEPNLQWPCSMCRSVGRRWGLAANW